MIKLEQYRDLWLSEMMNEVIGFYPREFYPLDNFSSFKVEWDGYLYSSVEEAYQAASFMGSDEEMVQAIKNLILLMRHKDLHMQIKIKEEMIGIL